MLKTHTRTVMALVVASETGTKDPFNARHTQRNIRVVLHKVTQAAGCIGTTNACPKSMLATQKAPLRGGCVLGECHDRYPSLSLTQMRCGRGSCIVRTSENESWQEGARVGKGIAVIKQRWRVSEWEQHQSDQPRRERKARGKARTASARLSVHTSVNVLGVPKCRQSASTESGPGQQAVDGT